VIQDVIDQLLDAKRRLAAAENHALAATRELENAERVLREALDGVDDLSLLTRLAEKRQWVSAGLGGVLTSKAEVDHVIRKMRAVCGDARGFVIEWNDGQDSCELAGPAELDGLLDRIDAQRESAGDKSVTVQVYEQCSDGSLAYGLALDLDAGSGALVRWTGDAAGLPSAALDLDGPLAMEADAVVAREAARQYLRTGRRPTCVTWEHG
jgi:hypothetical protein